MSHLHSTWIALFALFFVTTTGADEADFSGIVTRVFDGDSFLVRPLSPRSQTKDIDVRLMDIDAPEKDQPYADAARSALIHLIDGRRVFVDVVDIDRYGRKVAKVYREPDRLEIARMLVQEGHVWVNRRFAKDPTLTQLEDMARAQHRGLWSLPADQLQPPWDFRRQNGRKKAQNTQTSARERAAPVGERQ